MDKKHIRKERKHEKNLIKGKKFLFSETSRPTVGPTQLLTGVGGLGPYINQLHLSSTEIKNEWRHTSTPAIPLHGVDRKYKFYLYMPDAWKRVYT